MNLGIKALCTGLIMAWKVKSRGIKLVYGLDAFAQIVLSLEDLARMVERSIYDLQTMGKWYEISASSFFKLFGFEQIPSSEGEIKVDIKI